MEAATKKTWVSVVIASVIIVGILAITAVGGTAFFFYRHINAELTPRENAEQEFEQARARFAGHQPLIEMRLGDEPIVHRELVDRAHGPAKIETVRVLAYDADARKLVHVSIPFWLIRIAPGNHFSFLNDRDLDFDSDRMRLTADDLERLGPSLILDAHDRHGALVLVWTE
jgi:hypothetical protein